MDEYNERRPHEGLNNLTPKDGISDLTKLEISNQLSDKRGTYNAAQAHHRNTPETTDSGERP